jgi:hypothetical protein
MEFALKFFSEAPADRLTLLLAIFVICLMTREIKRLWHRNSSLETELNTMHELHRELVTRVILKMGKKE